MKSASIDRNTLPTVLIADDAKFMRAKLARILEDNGFSVVAEAEDGFQARELALKFNPDIITLDITMPGLDGISALKSIKEDAPDARIIMISALGQKSKVKECFIAGARDFIIKPFVEERVIDTLTKVAQKVYSS